MFSRRNPLSSNDAQIFLRVLKICVASNWGWRRVFSQLKDSKISRSMRKWIHFNLQGMEAKGSRQWLESSKDKSESVEKLVYQCLLLCERGHPESIEALQRAMGMMETIRELEREESSMMFMPLAQSIVVVFMFLIFAVIVPLLVPGLFPSFLHLGRWDDFLLGLFFLVLGVYMVWVVANSPRRRTKWWRIFSLFLFDLSLFTSFGKTFSESWTEAIKSNPGVQSKWKKVSLSSLKTVTLQEQLKDFSGLLRGSQRLMVEILVFKVESSAKIQSLVEELSDDHFREFIKEYRSAAKAASFLSLVPLSFCALPAVFYLLIGPQLVLFSSYLEVQ